MKRDTALATAVGAALSYVFIVGMTTSGRPAGPVTPNRPVAVEVTYSDTGREMVITDARHVASVCQWLDHTFDNPRSMLDLRLFSPPTNELVVYFLEGESTTMFFSGGDRRMKELSSPQDFDAAGAGELVIVQYEGRAYIANEVPQCFVGDDHESEHVELDLDG